MKFTLEEMLRLLAEAEQADALDEDREEIRQFVENLFLRSRIDRIVDALNPGIKKIPRT